MKIKINHPTKLVDLIKEQTNLNLKQIKKLLISNKILVNNLVINNTNKLLLLNDLVEIIFDDPKNTQNNNQNELYNQIKIVYEDDYFMIIYKPSGLLVHETTYINDSVLANWNYLNNNLPRSGICHRLDKNTAGLLIIAKTEEILNSFLEMFQNNQIIRKYLAIVQNNFSNNSNNWYLIETLIGRKNNSDIRFTTNNPKNPKEAKTKFRILKNLKKSCSLIECELLTGRTHQIRVHMNYINHPILNDPIYGTKILNDDYEQYLVAYYLKFIHPITMLPIEIKIETDEFFNNKLKELEN